jgi:putative ABC transport system ATP-binding protein/macrolide transport system ATP-binding/permease protein
VRQPDDDDPAVRAIGVTRRFASPSGAVIALDSVDADMERGRLTAIAGPSGSGKSSLLALLACTDRPDDGRILLGALDVTARSRRQRRRLRRDSIGIVLPQPSDNLLDRLDASGNLAWAARLRRRHVDLAADGGLELLAAVGLETVGTRLVRQLSGGEQQRLALACAVVGDPVLVVADEPTASLDGASADQVVGVLRAMADGGVTIVVAGHDRRVIEAADRVVELDHGRRVA